MAQRLYEQLTADTQKLWVDPQDFSRSGLQTEISQFEEMQALSDPVRILLANDFLPEGGDLSDLDEFIQTEIDKRKHLLDFLDYDTRVVNLTVADGAWFSPEVVETSCGWQPNAEPEESIDEDTGTYWDHNVNEEHFVTYRVRDYQKAMEKIRIWVPGGPPGQAQLDNIDILVGDSLDPAEMATVLTGGSVGTAASWNELVFTTPGRGRYLRLQGFGSVHATNRIQMNELEVWVTTWGY